MKILELRLDAFGPFTDRRLDLAAGDHGLHVIFGPNEAGKSSALRALHALLYGIPRQTADAFIHPYDKLRLGARLRRSSGEVLDVSRRKGIKATLLGPDDQPLADDTLTPFLGGVTAEQFRRLWGIDYSQLVAGGHEILEGRGDLGESLFAAGSGIANLRALRKRLDDEAAELFRPRGQNQPIHQSVKRLSTLRAEQRAASLSVEEWSRLDRAARDAEAAEARLAERLKERSRERSRLERIQRVLPLLAERDERRRHLADLGTVELLAPDFPQRRHEAETAVRLAEQSQRRTVDSLEPASALVETLGERPLLAAEAEAVSELYQQLGAHRRALGQRPGLLAQRDAQFGQAQRLLAPLRPDLDLQGAAALRAVLGRRARIQRLASEHERLAERLASAHRLRAAAEEAAETLAREAARLPAERDLEPLIALLEPLRLRGNVEAERDKLALALERDSQACADTLARLALPTEALDRLATLPVPTAATLADFERRHKDLEEATRDAERNRQRIAEALRALDTTIESLRGNQAVPSEQDVAEARQHRDEAFRLLRGRWIEGREVDAEVRALLGEGDLVELYRRTVTAADEAVDRLRRETDRVAELAQHQRERDRLAAEEAAAAANDEARRTAIDELQAAWKSTWQPVLASPPAIADGRAWCEAFRQLVTSVSDLGDTRREHDQVAGWIARQLADLRAALVGLDPATPALEGLAGTVVLAERLRRRLEEESQARADHARRTAASLADLRSADLAIQAARTELDDWRSAWQDATEGLGSAGPLAPDDALLALERVAELLEAHKEAEGHATRLGDIDREAEAFRAAVQALAARLGESNQLDGTSEERWLEEAKDRLDEVLRTEATRQQAEARLADLRRDLAEHEETLAQAQATLAALREEAKCDGDLALSEQRSAAARAHREALESLEKQLLHSGDGASLAELEAEAAGVDRDDIAGRRSAIDLELPEIEEELGAVRRAGAEARAELRQLEGPSVASEKAEEIQATLAQLGDHVLHYSRLRVAATLLARRIDDYRRENQAPLLLRASNHFRAMTLGAFDRLEADVDDDRNILVGVRTGGGRVASDGMSEGTRDQLFLALRLAAVEAACAAGEPLPLVVDDILVQFDDQRSDATLGVLAEVARHTQVVLFTHHRQVRQSAEALTATPAGVFVHAL